MTVSVYEVRELLTNYPATPQGVRQFVDGRLRAHLWVPGEAHAVRLPDCLCRGTTSGAWLELTEEYRALGWKVMTVSRGVSTENLCEVTLYFTKPE